MRMLVTGGAGFIGSHLIDALVASNTDEVSVFDDFSTGKRNRVNTKATFYQIDLRAASAVASAVAKIKPEVIIHLAAQMDVRRSVADPAFDAQVNLIGFLNLIESARAYGLRRVVFSSSGGAIYREEDKFPCTQDQPPPPVQTYLCAKVTAAA